jgi:stage III sporulation protein AH
LENIKRNAVVITVLLFVCVAVYLNWSYNARYGTADSEMVKVEDEYIAAADQEYFESMYQGGNDLDASQEHRLTDYFAAARLTRQQARDEALTLLQQAATTQTASQEIIDSAVGEITAMANFSLQEAQIENLLLAKDFADCVVFRNGSGVTVAVPAPLEGLAAAAVARITDIITSETELAVDQIHIIEIKNEID